MFRNPKYLEKTEYFKINLDTLIEIPGNNQHQRKPGYLKDRNKWYDWYNAYFHVKYTFEATAYGAAIVNE